MYNLNCIYVLGPERARVFEVNAANPTLARLNLQRILYPTNMEVDKLKCHIP